MRSQWSYPGEVYDAIRQYHRNTSDEIDFIKRQGLKDGDSILDVACGTGLLLRELSALPVDCLGFDASKTFISSGKQALAARRIKNTDILVDHMELFKVKSKHDVVLCLFNSICYLGSIDKIKKCLHMIRKATKPSGFAIIEFAFYLNFVKTFRDSMTINIDTNDMNIVRNISHDIDCYKGFWIHYENMIVNRNGKIDHYFEKYDQLVVLPAQMSRLLKEVGFNSLQFFADWKGGKVVQEGSTCIVVAS